MPGRNQPGHITMTQQQKAIIAEIAATAELGDIETDKLDNDTVVTWRNGQVDTGEYTIPMGGGWIASPAMAAAENERAGIAGGLRQGVSYPNETVAGEFVPYSYGEDESDWEGELMPLLLGEKWEDHADADEIARALFDAVQAALAAEATAA